MNFLIFGSVAHTIRHSYQDTYSICLSLQRSKVNWIIFTGWLLFLPLPHDVLHIRQVKYVGQRVIVLNYTECSKLQPSKKYQENQPRLKLIFS